MTFAVYTALERPDLWERGIPDESVWPEYNLHGDVLNVWWACLDDELAEFQFVLYDEVNDQVVAEGHAGPFSWDGLDEHLPTGIDEAIELIFAQRRTAAPVNTLCALAAEIPLSGRGRGLATELLAAMRTMGERHGLTQMVAPVRPSGKDRYPLADIEDYIGWRRDDGELLDPWMRVHERLGARVATPLRQSMRITATVAEWEQWTEMAFPVSGDYVFPGGLALVHIDRTADYGAYWEPNVWMVHPELRP